MDKLILIIEDDPSIIKLLTLALKTSGYRSIVAESGLTGVSLFLSNHPDCILLDLGLPDIDGNEIIKQIREISSTPIIVVSARGREMEKVNALDLGANDYVTKPFNVAELMARIRVALRIKATDVEKSSVFNYKQLFIDYDRRIVKVSGNEIHLTPIEFKLLTLLAENQGKVMTHSYIQNYIWGYPSEDEYQSLRVYMANLRKKLENSDNKVRYINTEIGIGYRFLDD